MPSHQDTVHSVTKSVTSALLGIARLGYPLPVSL